MKDKFELAYEYLSESIDGLIKQKDRGILTALFIGREADKLNKSNLSWALDANRLGQIALLWGFSDLVEETKKKCELWGEGKIKQKSIEEVEQEYPLLPKDNRDYLIPLVTSYYKQKHLEISLYGKLDDAFNYVIDNVEEKHIEAVERRKEEVLLTHVMLGNVDEALAKCDMLESFRARAVVEQVIFENFREGKIEAGEILRRQHQMEVGEFLVFGLLNRCPYQGYPYPDY